MPLLLKFRKAIYCLLRPRLWQALALGVAPSIEHARALGGQTFMTVVDIGANRGQFSLFTRLHNPDARIYAFEPLQEPAAIYQRLFRGDLCTCMQQVAIGASKSSANMNVTAADDSSSLLARGAYRSEDSATRVKSVEPVTICRLDDCLKPSVIVAPALLKIDVEGFEREVLKGCDTLLSCFDVLYVECSYLSLHEGQALAFEIIDLLRHKGFRLAGVFNQHGLPNMGPVQADFLFTQDGLHISPTAPARTVSSSLVGRSVAVAVT
jgi:FkbM family methyltransferase